MRLATLLKNESLAQMFSCEFCEMSKNTFSYRTPLVAASEISFSHLCKAAFTLIYILMIKINLSINSSIYISIYISRRNVFLLRNGDLYSIYTFQIKSSFYLKSINQEFLFFSKSLNNSPYNIS